MLKQRRVNASATSRRWTGDNTTLFRDVFAHYVMRVLVDEAQFSDTESIACRSKR